MRVFLAREKEKEKQNIGWLYLYNLRVGIFLYVETSLYQTIG